MKNTSNKRRLKMGGYTLIVTFIAIATVVFVNLIAARIPVTYTKYDMSDNDIYSVGDITKEFVPGLKDRINIYLVAETGKEDFRIVQMIEKYVALNSNISYEQIDPVLRPTFASDYEEELSQNSIIVKSDKRYKVISYYSVYFPGYSASDVESYYAYYGQWPQSTGFACENMITNALDYVTTDVLPTVYLLSGHGESDLSSGYASLLEYYNMRSEELSLLGVEAVPENCDCLVINMPSKDISKDEADKILSYMKKGGRVFLATLYNSEAQPNLMSVCEYYGLGKYDGLIYEKEGNYLSLQSGSTPYLILPSYSNHEITELMIEAKAAVVAPFSHGIKRLDNVRDSVTISTLLYTSDGSFSRLDPENNLSLSKVDGDISGPFDVAVAVSDKNDDGTTSQLVWFSSVGIMNEQFDITSANSAMFINSLNYLCEKRDTMQIVNKTFEVKTLALSDSQSAMLGIVFIGVVPLSVTVIGLSVWLRRRKR